MRKSSAGSSGARSPRCAAAWSGASSISSSSCSRASEAWDALLDLFVPLWPTLTALFISHGISFFTNYLGRREYLGTDLKTQMGEPYKRIVVMHLTIILGGFLTMLLRTPVAALLLLIALKTATDLYAHRKEHAR